MINVGLAALLLLPLVQAPKVCEICNNEICQCQWVKVNQSDPSDDDSVGYLSDNPIIVSDDETKPDDRSDGFAGIRSRGTLAIPPGQHQYKQSRLIKKLTTFENLDLPPANSDPEHFETKIRALFLRFAMGVSSLTVLPHEPVENYRLLRRTLNQDLAVLAGFDDQWALFVPAEPDEQGIPRMRWIEFKANQPYPTINSLFRRDTLISTLMNRALICAYGITML